VLDADALNLIARDATLAGAVAARSAVGAATLLTPHPAEAARLLACSTEAVQADRIAAARTLAVRFNAHVALKGCGTVLAHPEGTGSDLPTVWGINPSGNPGMSTAGMGDVLTGIALALLAQGWPPAPALEAAVHLHGAAADTLVAAGSGPVGLTAGETIPAARSLLNHWIATRPGG
jgi:NAD(P)H-hydrate repair Nnr-like enzyme with NAD(P)H-hydrate dehydratase domain